MLCSSPFLCVETYGLQAACGLEKGPNNPDKWLIDLIIIGTICIGVQTDEGVQLQIIKVRCKQLVGYDPKLY